MGCGATKAAPATAPKKILVTSTVNQSTVSIVKVDKTPEDDPHSDLPPAAVYQIDKGAAKSPSPDSGSIEEILKDIGIRLRLPQKMITKCIETLHENGIFILEPLAKATEKEWAQLSLPIAVTKELQEKIRSEGLLPPPSSRGKAKQGNTSLVPCPNCGKKFYPDRLEKHIAICKKVFVKDGSVSPEKERRGSYDSPAPLPSAQQQQETSRQRLRSRGGNRTTFKEHTWGLTDDAAFNDVATSFQEHVANDEVEKFNPEDYAEFEESAPPAKPTVEEDDGRKTPALRKVKANMSASVNSDTSDEEKPRARSKSESSKKTSFQNSVTPTISPESSYSAYGIASQSTPEMTAPTEVPDNITLVSMTRTFKNNDKYIGQFNTVTGKQHGYGKYIFANGDYYEGEFENGYFHGMGTFKRANGDTYQGDFKYDVFDGHGTYTYKDGEKYEGEYQGGERHGHGVYTYKNGNTFEGEFFKGVMMGEGIYTFANGDKYRGTINNGVFAGGEYSYSNGDVYRGSYKGSVPHGLGIIIYSNGDYYEGNFENGRRHGFGKYVYKSGKVHEGNYVNGRREGWGKLLDHEGTYEGEFRDGKMSGKGTYRFANGDSYEGEFQDNVFHGFGIMYEKGSKYEGNWVQGVKEGFGKWTSINEDYFEGEFHDNLMNGKGVYIWANGNEYRGPFKNGKLHGKGIFTFKDTGERVEGEFHNGKPPRSCERDIDKVADFTAGKTVTTAGKENWGKLRHKVLTNKPTEKVHTPFLGQYGESLF